MHLPHFPCCCTSSAVAVLAASLSGAAWRTPAGCGCMCGCATVMVFPSAWSSTMDQCVLLSTSSRLEHNSRRGAGVPAAVEAPAANCRNQTGQGTRHEEEVSDPYVVLLQHPCSAACVTTARGTCCTRRCQPSPQLHPLLGRSWLLTLYAKLGVLARASHRAFATSYNVPSTATDR
jgi:hypothetical protein